MMIYSAVTIHIDIPGFKVQLFSSFFTDSHKTEINPNRLVLINGGIFPNNWTGVASQS